MGPPRRYSSLKILLLIAVSVAGISGVTAAAVESEELKPLKCLLQNTLPVPCNEMPALPELPERLNKMYLNFSEIVKQAVWAGMLEILKPNTVLELPSFFINLLPMNKLSRLDGASIGAIVSNDPGNLAVLRKLSPLLMKRESWTAFVNQVKKVQFPTASQEVLGQMLACFLPHTSKWTYYEFDETLSIGTPLMAHLPPYFLDSLNGTAAPMFLFYLRTWYLHPTGSVNPWHGNSWSVLRRWARLAIKTGYPSGLPNWTTQDVISNNFFLDGATADELEQLGEWHLADKMYMNWDRLQARVLFKKIFPSGILTEEHLVKIQPLVPKLSPTNLQRFNVNATNFKVASTKEMSFITAKQVVEALIAQAVARGRMPSDNPVMWKDSIVNLGNFVFALPPYTLKPYLRYHLDNKLPLIDSPQLTRTQARYLTANSSYVDLLVPETLLSLRGNLLHTLDSKTVAQARPGEMSHRLRLHLLESIPPGVPVRSLAVLHKIRNSLGEMDVLESMLSNRSPEQFFSLLLPREVVHAASRISKALLLLAEEGYSLTIKKLPHNVLSSLLSANRWEVLARGEGWTEDTLLQLPSSLFLLGLTCNDLDAIQSTDVVAIFERYNRERIAAGQEFPKHLQYCAQFAMFRYLVTKAKLNGVHNTGASLLDQLDVSEVMAIGGYVLATVPVKAMLQTSRASAMLEAIGQLSLVEILVATSGNAVEYANLLVEKMTGDNSSRLMLAHLVRLGNLVHFMQPSDVRRINPQALKQFLDQQDGSGVWKTVCSSLDARAAWGYVIEAAFGPVENWTASILVTLGDMLAALPVEKLDKVPLSSWQAAADSVVDRTKFHIKLQWPGEPRPLMLYEVCGKLVDEVYPEVARGLARRYLLAVQSLLLTVKPASQLLVHVSNSSVDSELELVPFRLPGTTTNNGSDNTVEGDEINGISIEENLSLVAATVPGEMMNMADIQRSRRNSGKTLGEKQQYGDVLRSKAMDSRGGRDRAVGGTPSTTTGTEGHAVHKKVSCEAVRACGPMAGLGLRREDIDGMSQLELESCLDVLGTLSLPDALKQQVWTRIRREKIPVHLADVGSLLSELSADDLKGVSLDQRDAGALDTLAALSTTVTSSEVLQKIVQLFSDANFDNPHPSMGTETMMALGKVACMMSVTFLRRIAHSKDVFHASAALAEMDTCNGLCLHELVQHMLDEQFLGPVANWTTDDVRSLGVLAAGVSADQWSTVKSAQIENPISGLQPSAIKCMEVETLKAFSVEQLKSLNPVALAAMTSTQMDALSNEQRLVLKQTIGLSPKVLDLVAENFPSSSSARQSFRIALVTLIALTVLV